MSLAQLSPLPPLGNDDSVALVRNSFDSSGVYEYEGAPPVRTNRLFEAKAVNLMPRPKTSLGTSRTPRGLASASPSISRDWQLAPR